MEKLFQIGEIADLLQISRSKLRFWEQQGLLRLERNDENNYRQYTFADLLRVTDIIFYRNLHFSTVELEQLFQQSAGELEQELEKKEREITAQLQALEQTRQEIGLRCKHLQEAQRLQCQPYRPGVPDFRQVRLFRSEDPADWQRCMFDQYEFIGVQQDARTPLVYGLTAADGADCIWVLDPAVEYREVLLRFATQDYNENDAAAHCAALKQMGWQTGHIVSRFLFSSVEKGISYDYHKGWIAVWQEAR